MSEQEKLILSKKLREGLNLATLRMLETKLKLGQSVVISDSEGQPLIVSPEVALKLYNEFISKC